MNMGSPNRRLKEFQALYVNHYGLKLGDEDANILLSALVSLMEAGQEGAGKRRLNNAALVTNSENDAG